jgi:hypothetical protein
MAWRNALAYARSARGFMKTLKNRPQPKSVVQQHESVERSEETSRAAFDEPVEALHHVDDNSMSSMLPGDVLLLPNDRFSEAQLDAIFHAVLACPRCATLTPISAAQYFGSVPVMCCSDHCSCRFRIDEENWVIYLPVM